MLIDKYKKCIITGIDDENLLIASHIKPWVLSDNQERLNVDNGLLLSPLYDKLFDLGFISFDENMHILISSSLSKHNISKMSIDTRKAYIENPSQYLENKMKYHRDNIFKKYKFKIRVF